MLLSDGIVVQEKPAEPGTPVAPQDRDEALAIIEHACRGNKGACSGNAAEVYPALARRENPTRYRSDVRARSDQWLSAEGWTLTEWDRRRSNGPKAAEKAAKRCVAEHVRAMLAFWLIGSMARSAADADRSCVAAVQVCYRRVR
jgi:urocanate hydratase